jgi:hypothetical protein
MHFALTFKLQQIFFACRKEKVNWRKNIQVWRGGDWNYIQCQYWVLGRIFNVSEFTLPLPTLCPLAPHPLAPQQLPLVTSMSDRKQPGAWPGLPAARPCPTPLSPVSWPPP